jgi:aromatic amino acid aminotransferase I
MVPPSAIEVEGVTDTQGITLPEPTTLPLRINDVHGRRKTSGDNTKGGWGVAAPCTSAQFKFPGLSTKRRLKAKRWDHLLSSESTSRKGSSLKHAARFLSKPGLISLGGGLPSSAYFPFSQLTTHVPVPPHFSEADTLRSGTTLVAGKHDLAAGRSIFDISTAFNYGQGTGSAQMLRWVTEHTELVHRPPYADWACNLSIGSTSAFDMSMRMFTVRGDVILTEEYTYPTAIETAAPMGVKMIGMPMDAKGMLPDALERVLTDWDPAKRDGARKPRLLYTVPTGQNPTGATMSLERRTHIYDICQRHDVYILEDEPYFFLQMPDYSSDAALGTSHAERLSRDAFLQSMIPSFLSMDVDGRVLRMDSFSKVISPGSRVGWITASEQVIERYKMHVDASTQGPSGISQLVLFKLLDEHWGHAGYIDWLMHIRGEYTKRRNVIVAACETHLPRDIVSWVPPKAGMFVSVPLAPLDHLVFQKLIPPLQHWMRINWRRHPLAGSLSITDIEEQLFLASIDHGALVMRGSWFTAEHDIEHDTLFFRATYAAAPLEQIEAAIARFGAAVREVFGVEEGREENGNGHGVGDEKGGL